MDFEGEFSHGFEINHGKIFKPREIIKQPMFYNPMVYFKTTAKFPKSMEFFKTLGDMDQVNGPHIVQFKEPLRLPQFRCSF